MTRFLASAPRKVTIVEVGPRDGLQNEAAAVPLAAKIAFVEALAAAGAPIVEAGAFVHPTAVPRMADTASVFRGLTRRPGTRYVGLVPNVRGYERARECGADDVAVFTAASETFSARNANCTIAESLARIGEVMARARRDRVPVRAYVSTAWYCPYEGTVAPEAALDLTRRLLDLGAWQVSLGDTVGAATPREVAYLLERILAGAPADRVALHCHDTRGTALANVLTGLALGVSTVDASAGGLGGCPFAPGAAGNAATEDVVYMLRGMGIETGVSLEAVAAASATIEPYLDHSLPSRAYQALRARQGA